MRDAERRMRAERDAVAVRVHEELRTILPAVADHLTRDLTALIAAIRQFETDQGRRLDGKELIEALRNRMRKGPFADLEGLICTATLEENVIAVQDMRDRIQSLAPDAVLAVERGGAFLAEVLSRGAAAFPETLSVPKAVTPRAGEEDLVQRTPHLLAEIRRRILEQGQRRFVVVDFLMGGHFAEELQAMAELLHAEFPDAGIQLHAMWMRESEGYDHFATPAPSPDFRAPRPTVAQLELGASFVGGAIIVTATDPDGTVRRYLRFTRESETVTLPAIRSSAADRQRIAHEQFPVGVVLGDDMNTIFDPASRQPLVLFDTDGHIVQTIPVGTPDPVTGVPLETTRDILIRLMQGVSFPNESTVTTVP
jgi:adenine/guanine phosphoribosyltransferase-like PRPP-binding protein